MERGSYKGADPQSLSMWQDNWSPFCTVFWGRNTPHIFEKINVENREHLVTIKWKLQLDKALKKIGNRN